MLDLKDFYFSLNCIVQFKGLRVHAQVITPGVIFNSEHLVEYGEAEEGVIKFNVDFHENYKRFCEKLNIRELKVKDKNDKEYQIYGNPEIKGVRGVDRRKYLFDLNHLFPRDCNFLGEENSGCLLRPELIREYQMKLISQKISQEYQEEMKMINAEIEAAVQSAKDPQSYMQILEEKIKKKEEIFEKISNEIKPDLVLDTTLFTVSKLCFENAQKEKDEALLRNLAKFLKEESIEKFIIEVAKEDENIPSDCFSITEAVHKYGINIRYYGEILKRIENLNEEKAEDSNAENKEKSSSSNLHKKNIGWIKSLIIRDLLRRAAKHLFNETTKDLPEYLVKEFSAYFLNVLLAPANLVKYLDTYTIEYVNGSISAVRLSSSAATENSGFSAEKNNSIEQSKNLDSKNKKKKNKNKKKKNKGENDAEFDLKIQLCISDNLTNKALSGLLEPSAESIQNYFIKPSVFWKKMEQIIKKRYNFDIEINENFENIEHPINKYGLLRDFCLTVGMQVEASDYELYFDNSNKNDFKYALMPFKAENVINFFTVCKDFYLPSEIHKPLFDQAEAMFKSGNLMEAAEKYKQVVYLCNEVYGPINHYSAVAHKKLGEISYLEGDVMNAIHLIQKSIIIAEKMYNFDSSFVGNAYAELSTYFHMVGQDLQAFKYLLKSLEIVYFTYPRNVFYLIF
jgi:protein TIF31